MWKDYFNFSKKEKNGTLVLLLLLALAIVSYFIVPYLNQDEEVDMTEFEEAIGTFKKGLTEKTGAYYSKKRSEALAEKYDTLQLFQFDPNIASKNDFKMLGLTDKQISMIANYKAKGGHFYNKQDFANIYSIDKQQYDLLAPYVNLPEARHNKQGFFSSENKNESADQYKFEPDSLFAFDPNTTSTEDWKKLGLSDNQISTMQKYISKGGTFYEKEDLKKMYPISDEMYEELEPYIEIKNTVSNKDTTATYTANIIVEINSADTARLKKLKGIGSYFAEKIVNYRKNLGGFVKKEQILEVYGMKKETYAGIKKQLQVDTKKVKKLRLNFAEREDLEAHPYLRFHQAEAIVEYRAQNGPFQKIKALRTHKIITQTTFDKIKPYLEL